MSHLIFSLADEGDFSQSISRLIIAGWTERDAADLQRHVEKLVARGGTPPPHVPCYYAVSHALLTTDPVIEVPRKHSFGEIEAVILSTSRGLLVGVGSDHTDRKVGVYDITVAKQMCAKPIGQDLWRFDDVADHWDELIARSWRICEGTRELYQEGTMSHLRGPLELMKNLPEGQLPLGAALFCGTQPFQTEPGWGEVFELELHDPKLGRSLIHSYRVQALSVDE